jgi:hypothetical protein
MTADARARLALAGARGVFALSAVVLALTALRSGRHARIESYAVERPSVAIQASSAVDAATPRTLDALLGRDPFDPSRVAANRPYRIGVTSESVVRPVAAQPVRLLGTVVLAEGRSFALCQLGSAAARVVYPGDTIGALRLVRVDQGSAVFIDAAGARIELLVPRSDGGRNDR